MCGTLEKIPAGCAFIAGDVPNHRIYLCFLCPANSKSRKRLESLRALAKVRGRGWPQMEGAGVDTLPRRGKVSERLICSKLMSE